MPKAVPVDETSIHIHHEQPGVIDRAPMTNQRAVLFLSGLLGCAPATSGTAIAPGAVDALPEKVCSDDDAACCASLEQRMRAARTSGDDRAADEEAERLALSCPQQRRDL